MAPSRKSRSVNGRFSYVEDLPIKGVENAKKSKQRASPGSQKKRKLADMLGPQWSKQELEHFYEAYRKYGKDWKKVAAAVHNRSLEMVEALYTMNRAYLSLPEGTASVVGLIAMMTDHYCVIGRSDSEQESNEDREASPRPHKPVRGKSRNYSRKGLDGHVPSHPQSHSVASSHGCLSLLKKRNSGIKPHAVRKRTPRIPISNPADNDKGKKSFSPGDSPRTSQTSRKTSKFMLSPIQNSKRKRGDSEIDGLKFHTSDMDEYRSELSLGSTEGDNEDYSRKKFHFTHREAVGTGSSQRKGNRYYQKKLEESADYHLDDIKEASSGTEGQGLGILKGNIDPTSSRARIPGSSPGGSRKRSKKVLFQKDEGSAFDALQTLADLSLMMPETDHDNESSVQAKEENYDAVDESKSKECHGIKFMNSKTTKLVEVVSDNVVGILDAEKVGDQLNTGKWRKKHKSSPFRISNNEAHPSSQVSNSQKTQATDEVNKFVIKGKRSSLSGAHLKQVKVVKPSLQMSSSPDHRGEADHLAISPMQVSSADYVHQPSKGRSKRKMHKPKPMLQRDIDLSGNICNAQHNKLKIKLSNCLASHLARRWCTFEWFYSAIDYPWFAKREFVEYLDHVGLGHVSILTNIEWGVIRSSLGRPRRFSEQFLLEEKNKLNQYRESVRTHYAELLAGTWEGLPTDLARPLFVGQRVAAIHPKTREIHDGSILTIDRCRCRVRFDQPELGIEFVMDIDCMPLNPLENMPTSFIGNNISVDKSYDNSSEHKLHGKCKGGKIEEHVKISPCKNPENIYVPHASPSTQPMLDQPKQGTFPGSKLQPKVACSENVQEVANFQPSIMDQLQRKEADLLALSALTRAIERKVSSALLCVTQHNAYQGTAPLFPTKPVTNSNDPGAQFSSFNSSDCNGQESVSHVAEIVEGSRTKARTMVHTAMQAMSSYKKMENKAERIEDAIGFVSTQLSVDESAIPAMCSTPAKSHGGLGSQSQPNNASSHASDPESKSSSDQNQMKIPSELIAHCLSTLLMIQKCTERQFPPADVAQVLDSAVSSLQPYCSKNLSLYAEIQKCMGIIRNQILALVPT